ncbi:polyprenyl synthetase family protein [bacterium D16-51]|nr:polyprenyl synthetase family protein [bacterium D16-59]RKI54924.1 polyprenyl synthetase family protein [bacterium D16-51]
MKLLEDDLFQERMQEKVVEIEEMIKGFLPIEMTEQKTIFAAMEYSLMAGGKRLRPMLLQESYGLFGGKEKEAVQAFMAAIEMIHTYSLVHDDLPAMDNDDYRRGKETTHRVFGEDMGILAGDALLNFAYETAIGGIGKSEKKEAAVQALAILAKKAGIFGMVGGQAVDVEQTGKTLTKGQLDFIYRLKTGALLEASLMAGAALAGAGQEVIQELEEIGKNVGMAFQIQDDILDLTSTTEELGKPVLSDEKNEKTTYVSLYGMEKAKHAVEEYSNKALELLAGLPAESAYLNTLILKLIHRTK